MPRTTAEHSARTAAAVRAVAHRAFVEHGYAGVGLETVAADAGVTRGAVYHHYGSKAGLFRAVLADAQERVAGAVALAVGDVEDPWRGLLIGCRAFLAAAVDDDNRRILLVDAPAVLGWDVWRELDAEHSSRLLEQGLQELADTGALAGLHIPALAAMLSGSMNEAALWISTHPDPPAATDAAVACLQVWVDALRGLPGS